jgi:large subunit ribosomal protein L10|tara:strand:+ start:3545 stop:4072 length:528 start_codon:yes stop_codon:yes gene_type:complete
MPMRMNDKQLAVQELHDIAEIAVSAVAADYHGSSVSQLTILRQKARESDVHLKVIRNTLAKKALEGTKFNCLDDLLVGPTMLAFSLQDPSSAAKLLNDFKNENKAFIVKGLTFGEDLLDLSRLVDIANLPSKDEAIALLMSVLNAPIAQLASTLNEFPLKLARVLDFIKQKKEQS